MFYASDLMRLIQILALALVLLAGCAQQQPAKSQNISIPSENGGAQVKISGFAFSPATLAIKAGTTVTWTNLDAAPHTVTGSGGFLSGQIGQGGTYTYTFTAPGTYEYGCSIRPSMRAKVVVQ